MGKKLRTQYSEKIRWFFEKYRQNAPARYETAAKGCSFLVCVPKHAGVSADILEKTTEEVALSDSFRGIFRDPAKCAIYV